MQEQQETLPGTEAPVEAPIDELADISSDEFLKEMMDDEDATTIEQEVFTEPENKDTPIEQVTKEEPTANTTTPEQPEEDHTNLSNAEIFEDETGNLVTQAGVLIAKNGKERRQYLQQQQDRITIGSQSQELQRLNDLEKEYKDFKLKQDTQQESFSQLGLNQDEIFQAAQMQKAWKNNPIETLNYLLTEARRLGHNIDGLDSGSTLDMNAINRTIEEKLNPITSQYQQQEQQAVQAQQNQQKVDTFIQSHEYSDIHGAHIAKIMTSQNMDASAAYWKLRQQATQLGLDFTKPLEEQAQSKLNGQPPQTTQSTPNSVPGVGDLGRSSNSSGLQTQTNTQQQPSQSFADIIKQSMKESNF